MMKPLKDTIFGQIPSDWIVSNLEENLECIIDYRGKTPKSSDYGIPALSAKSVKMGEIDYSKAYYVSKETYDKFMVRGFPRKGDVLLTTEAPLGCVAKLDRDGICVAQRLITLRGKEKILHNDYLRYFLTSKFGQQELISRATGSTVQGIKRSEFSKVSIILPTLSTQKAIAKILSDIDDKIAINQQINQTLEAMAQAVFKSWFVDFEPTRAKMAALDAGGTEEDATLAAMGVISGKSIEELTALKTTYAEAYEDLHTTASLFPSRLVESELGEIPEGWEHRELGKIVEPKKGKSITKKTIIAGDVPVVAGGLEPAYYHNQPNASAPVVTISASGANAGYVRLYYQDIWASDCSHINKSHTPFVYSIYVLLKSRQEELFGMQQGAAQPHIYPSDIMRLIIADAPSNVWEAFEKLVVPYFQNISSNIKEIQTLSQLRDSLLPKLLSGEINVETGDAA